MSLSPDRRKSILHASQEAVAALLAWSVDHETSSPDEGPETSHFTCADEIARLEMWIGEHEVLAGKLDQKLRDARALGDWIRSLLADLCDIAADHPAANHSGAESFVVENDPGTDRDLGTSADSQTLGFHNIQITDDKSTESNSLTLDTDVTLPRSLPDSRLSRVHNVISLLLQLGPTLLNPTPHSRSEQLIHSDAAQFDIRHVHERFPHAKGSLIDRLGRANWKRRQAIREARERKRELTQDREIFSRSEPYDTLPQAGSDKYEGSLSASTTSASVTSDADEGISDRGFSEPSHRSITDMTSIGSERQLPSIKTAQSSIGRPVNTTQQTTNQAILTNQGRYAIPLPPQSLTGEPFICPFCARAVSSIKQPLQWRKHVLEDLEPYMCTYADCQIPTKTYGSRRLWWVHEMENHRARRAWICTPCEQKQQESVYETPSSFEEHVKIHHPYLTPIQIQSIRDMCQRVVSTQPPDASCPLCQETLSSEHAKGTKAFERTVRKHISDHLEQLTYFVACPAGQMLLQEDDSDFRDDSDSELGLHSDIRSITSKGTMLSRREVQRANVERFLADQRSTAGYDAATSPTRVPLASQSPALTELAPSEISELTATSEHVPLFPISLMVPPRNEFFCSRQTLLMSIRETLSSPGSMCILHGVSGVGKTLTAVEYIYCNREHYDAIFWLQADTAPGLAESFLQMAIALRIVIGTEDHNQINEMGRVWLQDTDRRWLLVFDNALQWRDIARFVPNLLTQSQGSVLITTQAQNLFDSVEMSTPIHIAPLHHDAGATLLLTYLGRDPQNDPEKHLARETSAFVRGIPAAIAHVAGYVGYSQLTLEELIDIFRQWRRRTGMATDEADDLPASFREASLSYDEMLAMVWEVTLRELSQDARDVLNILAYLNCSAVPQDMLWNIHEDPSLGFLDKREKIRMKRINDSLVKRRLVNKDANSSFSMHRSLQRGIRERLSQDRNQQRLVFGQAVALVREVFPRSNPLQQPTPDKWPECQKLLPHLYALHDVYRQSGSQILGSVEFAQLLLDAGMDQFEQGIISEGLPLLKTAETVMETCSPDAHELMKADIHTLIALMYDSTGIEHRQEALRRRGIALDIRRRKFEHATALRRQDEILLYNSWMDFAVSLLQDNRYQEAEPIVNKCLAKFREWGPEEEIPFEYAKYYNNIALIRMYQARFEEAIEYAAHGTRLMGQTGYGLFASRFKFDLACIILQSGDMNRALQMHKEVHAERVTTVGATNELSLHSAYAVGAIYELQENYSEAEKWFRTILDQRRSFTSWPAEAFSRAQYHLACVLLAQGQEEGRELAEDHRDKALRVLDRLLPLDMPAELEGVTDKAILFDHMQPISPGGPRFTGRGLLQCFMHG